MTARHDDRDRTRETAGPGDDPETEARPERRSVLDSTPPAAAKVSAGRWLLVLVPAIVILATGAVLVRSVLNRPVAPVIASSERHPPPSRPTAPVVPVSPAPPSGPQTKEPSASLPKLPWLQDRPPPPPARPSSHQPSPPSPARPSPAPTTRSDPQQPWAYNAADVINRLPNADLRNGRAIFTVCAFCHTAEPGGGHRVGPKLWSIMGREKASHRDYAYSQALKAQGGRWTYEDMARYLYDTRTAVPGGKMAFAGIRDPDRLADVIAFMRTLADNPAPLPKAP